MSKISLYPVLFLIALFGLSLRLIDYYKVPPFGETKDEFIYPWAGMSLIKSGVPVTWSDFVSYREITRINLWGEDFRIISPWLDKPPLYALITGSVALFAGQGEFEEVRLSTIRLVPIFLSFLTIILVGLLSQKIFNRQIALIVSILYASVPTIVMANRMSLTENLLTPISLLVLWLFSQDGRKKWTAMKPYLVGLGCGLAIITKQVGMTLPITILALYAIDKQWKNAVIVFVISVIFGLIHPLIGLYYDWGLYFNVMKELRWAHGLGLPETIVTLFRFPGIGHKERIFLDGSILAGLLLLLTAPFWLKIQENYKKILPILIFPFIYLTLMVLIDGGQTWYGWYLFPLFPFLTILIGKAIYDLWQKPNFLQSLFFYLILGSSTVRFFLLIRPEFQRSWQTILGLFLLILVGGFILKTNYQRLILVVFFAIFLIINVLVIINLNLIYPGAPQPLY